MNSQPDGCTCKYLTAMCDVCRAAQPSPVAGQTERINDQPPTHWKKNDGWSRHPQTAEEWNWHEDFNNPETDRSQLRLNFAVDLADPHAPDQMALVLRIDLMRIMGRMVSAEAYRESHKRRVASSPSPQDMQLDTYNDQWHVPQEFVVFKRSEWNAAWAAKGGLSDGK